MPTQQELNEQQEDLDRMIAELFGDEDDPTDVDLEIHEIHIEGVCQACGLVGIDGCMCAACGAKGCK